MRQIKFRGRHQGTGAYVYGDYRQTPNDEYIAAQHKYGWLPIESGSVEQLIGNDFYNGKEIFEGDTVIRVADFDNPDDFDAAKTFPMAATFEDYGAIKRGEIIFVEAKK